MDDQPRCQIEPYLGFGQNGACSNPAAWVYMNGDYRRLECEEHAQRTRQAIRSPEVVRLDPLRRELGTMSG